MIQKFLSKLALAGLGSVFLGSCATILSNPSYLEMETKPENVEVTLKGVQREDLERDLVTPFKVKLNKNTDYRLFVDTENYRSEDIYIDRRITAWFWGNLIIGGGPVGMLIDYSTDEMWTHNPGLIDLDLTEASSAPDEFEVKAPVRLNYPDGTYETVFLPIKFYKKGTMQAQKQKCIQLGYEPGENINCVQLLQEWANDGNETMRSKVASSSNTPSELLQDLAQDGSHFVRSRVASNPDTSVKILQDLAEDNNKNVRWEVASNPNTTDKVLQKLAKDDNEAVSEKAEKVLQEGTSEAATESANDVSQEGTSEAATESTNDVSQEEE